MANAPVLEPCRDERSRRHAKVLSEVRASLFALPRTLSSKYFYDARGSELFERITELPEYYLTRAEREILGRRATEIVRASGATSLVELGAGSAAKTRILLDAMLAEHGRATYVPVDVSAEFLEESARALELEYQSLTVIPTIADIEAPFTVPSSVVGPVLFAFLGSTIGNFEREAAIALLQRIRTQMQGGDRLLLGTDLRKDAAVLNAAYNDSAGVTAAFNRNILSALNAELCADFAPERFAHRAFYDEELHRIEMHLDAIGDQVVHIPGLPVLVLNDGESIRTEVSCKYDHTAVNDLAASASLRIDRWLTDSRESFALSLLEAV